MAEVAKIGKRGTIVIPAAARKHYAAETVRQMGLDPDTIPHTKL